MKKAYIKILLSAFLTISCLFFFTKREKQYTFERPSVVTPFHHEGVYIQAKAYTVQESQKYLHRDLPSRGYQPIQISIQNNTPQVFALCNQSIDMPLVTGKQIAGRVLAESIPRAIGFKIASLFFWPLMIPGTIDSMITLKSHHKIKKELTSKSVKDYQEIILAYSTINRVIFVKRGDYEPHFHLSLVDQETWKTYYYDCEIV